MADPDLSSRLLFTHRALLSGEVTAPRDLFLLCLTPLVASLRVKFPKLPQEMWQDAATDAVLELIERPQRYDSKKSAVLTYLSVIAYRRLIDAIRKENRQTRATVLETDLLSESSVAEDAGNTNTVLELLDQHGKDAHTELCEGHLLLESAAEKARLAKVLLEVLPDARDRAAFELIAQGRTTTQELAAVLNLGPLAPAELQQEVKRHRDRIVKRVNRQRARWGDLQQ